MSAGLRPLKVVLLGDSGVGKTALLQRTANGFVDMSRLHPSVGFDFQVQHTTLPTSSASNCNSVDVVVALQLWDISGSANGLFILPTYTRGAACHVFVFDLRSIATFEAWKHWRAAFNPSPSIKLVVVGTHADEVANREVPFGTGSGLAAEYGGRYVEVSSMTGDGIDGGDFLRTVARTALDLWSRDLVFRPGATRIPIATPIAETVTSHDDLPTVACPQSPPALQLFK